MDLIEGLTRSLITEIGENPDREGLVKTPQRVSQSLRFLTKGYGEDIETVINDAIYEEDYDEMVSIIKNFPMAETLSWWRPQVDFLTEKTHLWKFEKGLDDDFGDWFSEKVGVDFKIDPTVNYAQNDYEDFKLDKTDKLIQNIKKFCSEDIEQLYPELL